MQLQPVFAGRRFNLSYPLERPDFAAAPVMGVLDADQPGAREVGVRRTQRRLDVRSAENAALAVQAAAHDPGQGGRAAAFVIVDVRVGIDEDFVARLGMGAHGQLVGHGAGGGVNGRLLAQEGGGLRL